MGLLPSVDGPPKRSRPGEYIDPGDPLPDVKFAGIDRLRAGVIEAPMIFFGAAFLYHKVLISGDDRRSWGIADIVALVVITYLVIQAAPASRRWF